MALPASFLRDGYLAPAQVRKTRRLLVGTEGDTNTGKTEWAISAPGPGIVLCLDRGFDSMLDNPRPPETRRQDFAFSVIPVLLSLQAQQPDYQECWKAFRTRFYKALENPDAKTVVIDGDSDSWELQRLAAHGKLTGVFPQTNFTEVKAARRALIAKAWDSGKNIIATNKLKDEWKPILGKDGEPLKDDRGEIKREATGGRERQGFPDQSYLWHVQIRHLYQPPKKNKFDKMVPAQWGLRILKCKANTEHEGSELWGADCSFASLVQLIYPQVPLKDWGY